MNSTLARFKFDKKQIRNKEIENLENEQSSQKTHGENDKLVNKLNRLPLAEID